MCSCRNYYVLFITYIRIVFHHTPCPEKVATLHLPLTLPNAHRVTKFFHQQPYSKVLT